MYVAACPQPSSQELTGLLKAAASGLSTRLAQGEDGSAASETLVLFEQQTEQLKAAEVARGELEAQVAALQGSDDSHAALQAAEGRCVELQESVASLTQRLAEKVPTEQPGGGWVGVVVVHCGVFVPRVPLLTLWP